MVEATPFYPLGKEKRNTTFAKEAFDAVMEGGSYARAQRILSQSGVRNNRTGKPYTKMGVYHAAVRYLCDNCEELKPILLNRWRDQDGIELTDEQWERFIVHKAATFIGNGGKKRFFRWVDEHPWAEKYEHMYAKRFGL